MELSAEYVGPDGERQQLRVSCEASGDADPLQSLQAGVSRMKEMVVEFFGPLVEQDARGKVAAASDDATDGDDEDDAEDDNNIGSGTNSDGPSAKRPKPPS